jgi:membrane-bound serine protease (ClpP class)
MRRGRALVLLLGTLLAVGGAASTAHAQASLSVGISLDLSGVVDPFMASYIKDGLSAAADQDAALVLITIDTPGGLDSAMRDIVQGILDSRIPVICYVSPQGARAASAGAFILIGCPVAGMAPGTNVGAAHPVGLAGAIESEKATNDAAAYIRSLADLYGRNADWAEQAVRESVSVPAEEALSLNVIDLVAPDVPTLLADVDGREVPVAGGATVTLDTGDVTLEPRTMGAGYAFLHALFTPDLAFIFFWVGLALIVAEFFVPGGIVGTIGGILVVLAIISFGLLPVQLIGVVFLLASIAFFVLELKLPGHLIGTIAGTICLILGGAFLFNASVPDVRVTPWVIGVVAAFAVAFFVVVIQAAIRMRKRRSPFETSTLIGKEGRVVKGLEPTGVVLVGAEEWTAQAVEGAIAAGAKVRVVSVDGLRLSVAEVHDPREAVTPISGWGNLPGSTGGGT